jgi:hypothetical protein
MLLSTVTHPLCDINTVAVYRVLYGEDFIQESIRSILPHVDKVFVIKAEKPWGNTRGVTYKGTWVPWPDKFDNTREKVLSMNESKVEIIDDYWPTPKGQLTHIVNDLILPRCKPFEVVFIEPDHVFTEEEAQRAFTQWSLYSGVEATTRQIELWKTPEFCIPDRPNRTSVVFHRIFGSPIGETGFNGAREGIHRLQARVHNLGFCLSPQVMYWKHLTALAFSRIVGDSPPNEGWYEEKWLNWDLEKNNSNLEISLGYEWTIPFAMGYATQCLPESIKARYNLSR